MGNCTFCGEKAGFLRKLHGTCQTKHEDALAKMESTASIAAYSGEGVETLSQSLAEIAAIGFATGEHIRRAIVSGWRRSLQKALDLDDLSEEEELRLSSYARAFGVGQDDFHGDSTWTDFIGSRVLRRVSDGFLPSDINITFDGMPFNLQKSEQLIWAFPNTSYFEEVTKREYVGGSTGYSMRVAKGFYLRQSSFKGRAVDRSETVLQDVGVLGLTTKHMYFAGGTKSFRVRYSKLVSITPYSDGVGIFRDLASARPETFMTGNGWLTANLIEVLSDEPNLKPLELALDSGE